MHPNKYMKLLSIEDPRDQRIRDLEAALKAFAAMWGSKDAHSETKRAQAKRAAMWDLYYKAMEGKARKG